MRTTGPFLIPPRITPVLDPAFRPAPLARRAFHQAVLDSGRGQPVKAAVEQPDGSISHFSTDILPPNHPSAGANFFFVERWLKFILWSRGGHRIYLAGPDDLADELGRFYALRPTGRFDAQMMGERIYGRPFEVVHCHHDELPPPKARTQALGRNLDGCRIGFDLGGSDRKVAAVIEGEVVFSEETVWDPIPEKDPQWHFDQIMDSLKKAAAHLPRVDAIGGSAAGVYVNSRVRVASLFRGVPLDLFRSRIKDLFIDIRKEWNNIPFEVVNDGEVTALAGSMAIGDNGVLGVALGTSTAGGYVTPEGGITSWLNELAFVPVDYQQEAAVDEWSGDAGCAMKYFSQQCVGRLVGVAGIPTPPKAPLPEILNQVQKLHVEGDYRAQKIYETIGAYLGYTLVHFNDFYDYKHVLILGRVTSGSGGQTILDGARQVMDQEFPEVSQRIMFHIPGEKEKRHGQAIAAASLPAVVKD